MVCVTRAGAGVDSAWEQEKPEVRKMPENAADSPESSAGFVGRVLPSRKHALIDNPFFFKNISRTNIIELAYIKPYLPKLI